MCLAIPARIVELLDGDQCRVELGGVRKEISLALVDDAAVGDYVIVHVGYALTKELIHAAAANPLDAQLDMEAEYQGRAGRTPDYAEGVMAFFDKRAPKFSGRE